MESPYAKVLRAAAARRKKIVKEFESGKFSKSDLGRRYGISPQRVAKILQQERAK